MSEYTEITLAEDDAGERVETCLSVREERWSAYLIDGGGECACETVDRRDTERGSLMSLRDALTADYARRVRLIEAALAKVAK